MLQNLLSKNPPKFFECIVDTLPHGVIPIYEPRYEKDSAIILKFEQDKSTYTHLSDDTILIPTFNLKDSTLQGLLNKEKQIIKDFELYLINKNSHKYQLIKCYRKNPYRARNCWYSELGIAAFRL